MINSVCSRAANTSWDSIVVWWSQKITFASHIWSSIWKINDFVYNFFSFVTLSDLVALEFILLLPILISLILLLLLLHKGTWSTLSRFILWIRIITETRIVFLSYILWVVNLLTSKLRLFCLFKLLFKLLNLIFLASHLLKHLHQNWYVLRIVLNSSFFLQVRFALGFFEVFWMLESNFW
jgi:hypothetical protein